MDLDIITLSVVSQTEKGKHHMISFVCGILKNINIYTNELISKTKRDSQT